MKTSTPWLNTFLALLLAFTVPASAAARDKHVKYVAPDGFNGQKWGELRTGPAFSGHAETLVGVGAAWMAPVQSDISYDCVPTGTDGCSLYATLNSLRMRFEGGGFYVLSEYIHEDEAAQFGNGKDGVIFYPVVYQFCANWQGFVAKVPAKFDEVNMFCGMRLMFKSETREQLRGLPLDHVSTYEAVLEKMIEKFGKPQHFSAVGRVIVEPLEGKSSDQRDRRFRTWRWCPARDRGVHTKCEASVVLSIDPDTGTGNLLYSTPLLWEYAYARQNFGFKNDPYFKMLHARKH